MEGKFVAAKALLSKPYPLTSMDVEFMKCPAYFHLQHCL